MDIILCAIINFINHLRKILIVQEDFGGIIYFRIMLFGNLIHFIGHYFGIIHGLYQNNDQFNSFYWSLFWYNPWRFTWLENYWWENHEIQKFPVYVKVLRVR